MASYVYKGRSLDFLGHPRFAVDAFGVVWANRVDRNYSKRRYWKRLKGTILNKGVRGKKVYRRVHITGEHGQKKAYLVHRLVLLAFVGPCPPGMEACHDDNDGLNNWVGNLRWDTPVNNQRDRIRHGTRSVRGTTEDLVRKIRREYRPRTMGYEKLGRKYGLHFVTVSDIVNRVSWKHVK